MWNTPGWSYHKRRKCGLLFPIYSRHTHTHSLTFTNTHWKIEWERRETSLIVLVEYGHHKQGSLWQSRLWWSRWGQSRDCQTRILAAMFGCTRQHMPDGGSGGHWLRIKEESSQRESPPKFASSMNTVRRSMVRRGRQFHKCIWSTTATGTAPLLLKLMVAQIHCK